MMARTWHHVVAPLALAMAMACGGVDDAPLGGPYGGSAGPTDPNGGQNGSTTDDSGTTAQQDSGTQQQQQDSGQTTQKDASGPPPTVDSGGPPPPTAPTWTSIYNGYMASGAEGRCSACHSQSSSASKLYTWLQGKGYISGATSALVDSSQSCLSWYGGNMPPSGPSDAKAVSDMNAWAAAGALNN